MGHFSYKPNHQSVKDLKDKKQSELHYFWISFLDGFQRILLFTKDGELVQYLQAARDIESPLAEYSINFQGLGLSLVNNSEESCQELLYMRVAR